MAKHCSFYIYDDEDIVYINKISDVSAFFQKFINDLRTGKLSYTDGQTTIKEKLNKVKLANETIKIWKEFKNGGFSLDQMDEFVNNGKFPIYETQSKPKLESNTPPNQIKSDYEKPVLQVLQEEKKTDGIDENNYCETCNHYHIESEPRICTGFFDSSLKGERIILCNCGIRG